VVSDALPAALAGLLRSPAMDAADTYERNLLYCQIVAQLLIADAAVTDEERAFLERVMDRFQFDATQKQAVFNGVNIGEPVGDKLARLDEQARYELLDELEAAAEVDGTIDPGEQQIIDDVRKAIGGG
jgi:uncharacterized tellurite resistance protein B-like protein